MAFPSLSRWLPRALFGACVVAAAALILLANSASQAASPAEAHSSTVVQLRIDGEIEPVLAGYIVNGIHEAALEHASLILITINTPGGLDTSMRAIIQAILQSPVPVVNYVSPTGSRAASAGFFILLSADVAAMAPGTDTGAASPITEIGGQTVNVDETLRKKILNEATAYLRSYVSKRGRNADLAATAVTDAKAFSEKEAIDGQAGRSRSQLDSGSAREAQRAHDHPLRRIDRRAGAGESRDSAGRDDGARDSFWRGSCSRTSSSSC